MGIPVIKEKIKKTAALAGILAMAAVCIKIFLNQELVISVCSPVLSFVAKDNASDYDNLFEEVMLSEIPFFAYAYGEGLGEGPMYDEESWQRLLASGEIAAGDEENVEGIVGEDVESGTALLSDTQSYDGSVSGNVIAEDAEQMAVEEAMTMEEALLLENENAKAAQISENANGFVPHERQQVFNMADYQDFTTLFKTFYAMDSNTMIGREELNVEKLLEPDVTVDKTAPGPQILIYHTHSQETFADSVPGDKSTSIVGAGEKLARLLTETYGYSVLHHTGEYDVDDRDSAYSRSLPALEQILAENPSIQVIIDLHRDGVAEDTKLAVDLGGRPTAQFMFFNGLSRTKNTGDIDYLYNPYQADNLALSFQAQLAVDEYYPGLARRIYLNGYRYNMHLRPSLLVELGAQTNTVEEIMNAVDPLAHVLDLVFSGKNPR